MRIYTRAMRSDARWLIQQLLRSGMKEVEIVEAMRTDGVEVTQATINRIKTGKIKQTSFDIGMGLVRLHDSRPASRARA